MTALTPARTYLRRTRVWALLTALSTTLLLVVASPTTSLAASLTEQLWATYDGHDLIALDLVAGRPVVTAVDVDTRTEVRDVVEQALSRGAHVEWDAPVRAVGDTYQHLQWGLDDINAKPAWSLTAESVVVAVLDTGVNQHAGLAGRVLTGYNSLDGTTNVNDGANHGTHVAGIIAANSGNDLGIAGVAHNAVILPVKVLGDDGFGTTVSLADGLIWATDNGARIANLSLGGTSDSVTM